jgi:peptidoglycan/xylan/chitin deacetylase (PgdA/CDA1 family)
MLARDYEFVSIDWVLSGKIETRDGRPPVLVTFDDAYESVTGVAADICDAAGVPSVFFVNGAFVNNATLALDNLVAWIVNNVGMAPLAGAASRGFRDTDEFFGDYLPSITLEERRRVFDTLAGELPSDPATMATEASLYTTSLALAGVQNKGMTLGDHTWSHVHCRHLDQDSAEAEIGRNRRFLESIVDYPVTVFSYPYGSRIDASERVSSAVTGFGHQAGFLVESEANRVGADLMHLSRASVGTVATVDLFADLEILPVMRRIRNRGRQS